MGAEFAARHPENGGLIEKYQSAYDSDQYAYIHDKLEEDEDCLADSFSGLIDFISRDGGNNEPFVELQNTFENYKEWDWWDGFRRGMRDGYERLRRRS